MSHAETSGAGTGNAVGVDYSFAVAGVGLSLRTGALKLRREPRRRNFETLLQNSDIALRVSSRPLAAESPGRLIFDSGMVWRLYDEDGERVFRFWSIGSGPIPYKELRIGSDYRRGEIILHEPWQGTELPDPLEYPLDELLVVHVLGRAWESNSIPVESSTRPDARGSSSDIPAPARVRWRGCGPTGMLRF